MSIAPDTPNLAGGEGTPRRAPLLGAIFVSLALIPLYLLVAGGGSQSDRVVYLIAGSSHLAAAVGAYLGRGGLIWLGTIVTIIELTGVMLLALFFAMLATTAMGLSVVVIRTTPPGLSDYLTLLLAAAIIVGVYGVLVWLLVRMTRFRV